MFMNMRIRNNPLKGGDNLRRDDVWYVSYGSNISIVRFLYDILGGTLNGITFAGCEDPSLPRDSRKVLLDQKIVFDRYAYLSQEETRGRTFGRMYLLTRAQFEDIKHQERYEQTMDLGHYENIPVLSITEEVRPGKMYKDYFKLIKESLLRIFEKDAVDAYIADMRRLQMTEEKGLYKHVTLQGVHPHAHSRRHLEDYTRKMDAMTREKPIVHVDHRSRKR